MDINIAKTTDKEIFDVIENLKSIGHTQEDEACIVIETPFEINPNIREGRRKRMFMVLFPELLSYFTGRNWVTVPWICCKTEILDNTLFNEEQQRHLCRFITSELNKAGYTSFKDEDAFCGHFSREVKKDNSVVLKTYINPSFPDGYWSNHAL